MSKERTIRDHIQEVKESDYSKPPYQMENKPGRPKTWIKDDQRMFDTETYCLEVKKRLLQSLQSDLGLAADTLFMHDAIFVEGDPQTPFITPEKTEIKRPWWDDEEYLAQYDENMAPDMKVKKYLKDSL